MSEPITLPADIVWLDDGRLGVAIVQGDERRPDWWDESSVEFVAPQAWAQYDKPCEQIEHHRHLTDGHWHDDCGRCRTRRREGGTGCDCRDGRQVWTVRWPCSVCNGTTRNPDADEYKCPALCEYNLEAPGHVSARATIQVVPVVDFGDWEIAAQPTPCITVDDYDQCAVMHYPEPEGAYGELVVLDPLPTPGQSWAVIVRLVNA